MRRHLVRGMRIAVLIGLALAVMPWRGGTDRLIIYALMVLSMVYPEVVPRRRRWVREIGAALLAWRPGESGNPRA